MNESENYADPDEYIKLFGNIFTIEDFQNTEITVLKKCNYMISSCYVDEFINDIMLFTRREGLKLRIPGVSDENRYIYSAIYNTYPILNKIYKLMEKDKVYVGELFDFEMVDYLNKFI